EQSVSSQKGFGADLLEALIAAAELINTGWSAGGEELRTVADVAAFGRRYGMGGPRKAAVGNPGRPAARSGGSRTPNTSRSVASAASSPQRPCTPGPGGVADEHRYTPRSGVRYGFHRAAGRASTWRTVCMPQAMSPPT